jgi:hypothetical protein
MIAVLMPVIVYALGGRVLAAQSPGGTLSWTGRRMQRAGGLLTAAMSAVLLIYVIGESVPLAVTVPLWALLGYGVILGGRWLWHDWNKEQQARDDNLQKLAEEGKTYTPPRLALANRIWRWVFNGYAIVMVVALVYGLIRYLVGNQ